MMEVTIQKRVVFINLILICLVIVAIWAVPKLGGIFHAFTAGAIASTPTPEETAQASQEDALAPDGCLSRRPGVLCGRYSQRAAGLDRPVVCRQHPGRL